MSVLHNTCVSSSATHEPVQSSGAFWSRPPGTVSNTGFQPQAVLCIMLGNHLLCFRYFGVILWCAGNLEFRSDLCVIGFSLSNRKFEEQKN